MKLRLKFSLIVPTLFAVASSFAIDLNNNGMSDVWEDKFSIPPDAAADHYDGDPFTNAQESLLGTNPYDRLSRAHLDLSRDAVSPNDWHLLINTEIGKIYDAQSTTDLATWWTVQSGIMGTGMPADIVVTLADGSITKSFFRYRLTGETDADGDLLTLWEETNFGSSDNAINSDNDTLSDLDEFKLNQLGILLDPALEFTTPGVRDGEGDFDGDGVKDKDELAGGTNPTSADSYPANHPDLDLDFDELKDAWEVQNFSSTVAQDGNSNPDGDLLTNFQEQALGTDPTQIRTSGRAYDDGLDDQDGDNIIDIWEVEDGTDPNNASSLDLATNFVVLQGFMEHKATWGPICPPGQTCDPVAQFSGVTLRAQAMGFENARPTIGNQTYGLRNDVLAPFTSNGSGNYSIARSMRFRKGVRYKVDLLNPNNVQQMPFVSGKYNWVSGGNGDEPDNVYFAYEVTNRQWYRADPADTVSPILASPPKPLDPNPDVNNVHFTQKGPASGGPDATLFPTGTLFLNPVTVTPNPMPVTGIDTAKVVFNKGLVVPNDLAGISVKVNGVEATSIYKDLNEPQTIYFTPPPSTDAQTGRYEFEITGIALAGLPLDQNNNLKLHKTVRYTTDSIEGIRGFSASNAVNIQAAESVVKFKTANGGLTDSEALSEFSSFRDNHATLQLSLFDEFFSGRVLSEGEAQKMRTQAAKKTAKFAYPYRATLNTETALPARSQGVQVRPTEPDAHEGAQEGVFTITRPAAAATSLTVEYTVSGTATADSDYTSLSGSAVIPANENSVNVPVAALSDGNAEPDESVILRVVPSGYAVGFFDTAIVTIRDSGEGAAAQDSGIAGAAADEGTFPAPVFPSKAFFTDVKALLANSGKQFYYDAPTFTDPFLGEVPTGGAFVVFNSDSLKLDTHVVTTAGTVIDDVISAFPGAEIIINGALCNYGCKNPQSLEKDFPDAEPLRTIGVVKKEGVVNSATSSDPSRGSWKKANKRFWFGQTADTSAAANAGGAQSYRFGGPAANLPAEIQNGVSGLLALVFPERVKRTTTDLDLAAYGAFKGIQGFNVIAVDRDSGLLIIFSKAKYSTSLSLFEVQNALYNCGVELAVVTDGGDSVASYAKGTGMLAKGSRHRKPPDEKNTVTNYMLFAPGS